MQTQSRTLLLSPSTLCTFYDKTIYITAVFMYLSKDFTESYIRDLKLNMEF
jgi:hypothetical protein